VRALVYRGPASLPGCPEAVASLLAEPRWGLDVRFVGPKEDLALTEQVLDGAALYAQPGGGTLRSGWRRMRRHRRTVRNYVDGGGRYLGFCLGAYLAGESPGFGLLPGDTDQYVGGDDAVLDTEDDALVDVDWRGHRRTVFAQDPAVLVLDGRAGADTEVLARYPDGPAAALVAPYGEGRVGVVGPHPEATSDWFTDAGLRPVDARDLARDLVDRTLQGAHP
jgi:glutamine amidotransferase-like uncharacterized protein